jgi:anaerobic ribonucleoside-triphosphate reductase activating protein
MRISGITKSSYVNGPGRRNILHVQGCTIGCPGCFNKHTWPKAGGEEISPQKAAALLLEDHPHGITISGGEPMEQWDSVRDTIEECLVRDPGLSVIIFTGWTRKQLEKEGRIIEMSKPYYQNKSMISMVISGPYIEKLACNKPMISSSNQEIIYTNPAYEQVELSNLPKVEVHCENGLIKITGLPDGATLEALTQGGL